MKIGDDPEYEVWVEYHLASGKKAYGRSVYFKDSVAASKYAIKRAKKVRSGAMVYVTDPEGYSEQYDPGSWR